MFRVRVKVYRLLTAALPQPVRKGSAFPLLLQNILAAMPPEAEPQGGSQVAGKPEAFRTERGRAATEPGRAPQRNPVEPHRPRQSRQGTRQGPSRNAAEPPR